MRLLVTGGSGFTGQRVLARAAARRHAVVALVRSDAAAATVERLGARAVRGDLDRPESLAAAFTCGAEGLLNLTSLGFGHAQRIVDATVQAGIPRAVFVSTTAVTTGLAAGSQRVRLDAEQMIRESSLDWTIVRPTMIYGAPGDRNLSRLLALIRKAPIVPLPGGGRRLQQPVHVEDLADALVAAIESASAVGRTYNIAGPQPVSFRELVVETAAAVGRRPVVVAVPLGPAVAAARLYERLSRHPRIKAEQLERLAEDKAFSIEEARRDLGFAPRSFRAGIRGEAQALAS
ncbi:MAG: NAD(P)H-binding protein [Mycobacteriales bacterium]|nr:NAD(P)H-binding protein [Frankia sp.]MCA1833589.1 NAD(P)H-binding protein [Actinomycetota bacterium]